MHSLTEHRSAFAAGSLAALAISLAGCGTDAPQAEGQAGKEQDAVAGALKFARCMREQGLDFPDPQVSGKGLIKMGPGPGKDFNPDDPKIRAAQEKCETHLEGGGGRAPDAATQAKFQDAFLKFAACMRRNGIDMPDPKPGSGGGILLRKGDKSGPDPESPAFQAADKKCHGKLDAFEKSVKARTP